MKTKRALILLSVMAVFFGGKLAAQELHWYRGDTHVHTFKSDGNSSPEAVARWYHDYGYQFLVITDHETLTDVKELNRLLGKNSKFLVLKGEEVTQELPNPQNPKQILEVHVNAIDPEHVIHSLGPPSDEGHARMAPLGTKVGPILSRNVDQVRAAGAIPQVNHPNAGWGITLADLMTIKGPFLMEIMNPGSDDLGGTDEKGNMTPSVEKTWDDLLSRGKTVWGVACDDAHDFKAFADPDAPTPGRAWITVHAKELSEAAITKAIARGDFYASTGVVLTDYRASTKEMSLRIRSPLHFWETTRYLTQFVGQDGKILASVPGMTADYRIRGDEHYVRVVVTDSNGKKAWIQPVFLDTRGAPERR